MYSFNELQSIKNRKPLIGMKAESLIRLREGGFNVPDGFVITSDEAFSFSEEELGSYLKSGVSYAVRSSGTSEDLADSSFAGQYDTFLNVSGAENLSSAIRKCAGSLYNERVAAYCERSNIDFNDCKIAVIVQEMVNSDKAGVAFSVDSINGNDKEILIEAVKGLGEQLVSGHVTPDSYSYNWYAEKTTVYSGDTLSYDEVRSLALKVLEIQIFYGFPVDVEWAFKNNEIYILQSRPVTVINYRNIPDEWTTADFRDGGVSAAACKTLMGSLYGLVFNASFLGSLKTIKLLDKNYGKSIYETYFARPYWNLTIEKECFAKLPGYVEREIDEDMGIVPAYEGDGEVTGTNIKSILSGITSLLAINGYIKRMEGNARKSLDKILESFKEAEKAKLNGKTADELHKIWIDFVKNNYYLSEYTYFSYIFCNIILSTLFKDKIKKYLSANKIMNLMTGLSDLSHMRPVYEMWDMGRNGYNEKDFEAFIEKYKHHSQHELDISFPNWDETPDVVKKSIADFTEADGSRNPIELGKKQEEKYRETLTEIPEKIHKDVFRLRRFLWLREEFRDASTKSYYIIRKLTLALGKAWAEDGLLENYGEIFFLSVNDIEKKADLRKKALMNKSYYNSFLNFTNPGELGRRHTARKIRKDGEKILKGVACSGETITATARVIKDIHDAGRLMKGDILVTKCTDPAWTAVFSKLGGVITETGGMLSHAAVVSREYGLPCILVVKNATEVIKDGDIITMDMHTGEIYHV